MAIEQLELDDENVAAASGDDLPQVPLPTGCPSCGNVLDGERLRRLLYVCDCGHHFRLGADAWIALLATAGTWEERWTDLQSDDYLEWREPRPYADIVEEARRRGLNEAVRVGRCQIGRHAAWLAVFDFRFLGGTLSVVGGERLARGLEHAHEESLPFVLVTASGGARMQEGVLALLQMAKVNAAVTRLQSQPIPFVTVLTDPTFGGTAASLALLSDVNIAEPRAAIGFTGARVIKQATHSDLPPGFQSAEFQLEHGQIDMVVARPDLRRRLVHLLDLYRR